MKDTFSLFPKKHLLPYDGMSITAGVWREAHTYHQQMLNAHQVFVHGSGIVTGLEVVASDPADSVVFVLPGVAIDGAGKMIVLTEPVAYDLGKKMDGRLYLLLLHREVKVNGEEGQESNAPAHMQDEFVIVARPDALDVPHVELGRVFRKSVTDPIADAPDPSAPQPNTLDLRFRRAVCPPPAEQVLAGVYSLNGSAQPDYAQALARLARPLAAASPYHLIVENHAALDASVFTYRLLYLVVAQDARLTEDQAQILRGYLEAGGKLLVEFTDPLAAEQRVVDLLKPAGVHLQKLTPEHPAFQSPYLFMLPPNGRSQPGASISLWGDGGSVLCTNGDYAPAWNAQSGPAPLDRGAIRDAAEWGVNLLVDLLARS